MLIKKMEHQPLPSPHVLIFPLPAQGHVTPMLNLAELLCLAKFKVTFINTTQNHQRLTQSNIEARFTRYPGFRFRTIPDWIPNDRPMPKPTDIRPEDLMWLIKAMISGLAESAEPILREILFGSTETDKITCLIIDGWLKFVYNLADTAEVPIIAFRCSSACCTWAYYCIPKLIEAGVPFKGNDEMDQLVRNVPGMENFLRCRDLPSFSRGQNKASCCDLHQFFTSELQGDKQAHSLILNTFEDLEGLILSQIRSQFTRVYPIGPLHAQLKYRLDKEKEPLYNHSSNSLWEVDKSCMSWLDQKPDKSVVYVSLGSTTILTKDQHMEIWAGLVQSMKYFLWVVRPDSVTESDPDNPILDSLLEGTKKRGCMVKWAPQDEVLTHRATGGFLTHSGWNSTLESIIAGVPMLCWPWFADQQVNSRFISEVWRIGLDMKDTCDRNIMEKMINDLMDERKDELQKSIEKISHTAKSSVTEGGSSYSNLNLLIKDIKAMS